MIKLPFIRNREIFNIEIEGKEIYYSDRIWKRKIRLIPKDTDFIKKIIMSRNKIPHYLIEMFDLTKKEQKEYDDAKGEEELAEICINDCKKKGCLLLRKEND